MPEMNVYLRGATDAGDQIFLYGFDESKNIHFYKLSKNTQHIMPLPNVQVNSVVSISSIQNDTLFVLSITEDGLYVIYKYIDGILNTTLTLEKELYENSAFFDLIAFKNGFYLKSPQGIVALDTKGKYVCYYGDNSRYSDVVRISPEKVLVIYYGSFGNTNSLNSEHVSTLINELNENFEISATYEIDLAFSPFIQYEGTKLLALLGQNLYEFDYITGTCNPLINIQTSSLELNSLIQLTEDIFFSIQDGYPCIWSVIDSEETQVLTLFTYNIDYSLLQAINSFNSSNPEYLIEIKDYASVDTYDKQKGLTLLTTDIVSGKIPDIYDLSYFNPSQLAERGLLQDLKPYFESDAEIGFSDLVPSVIKALEYKDGLFQFTPWFTLVTACTSNSTTNKKLSIDDFLALTEQFSTQDVLGPEITRSEFLKYILFFMKNDLYSEEFLTCSFSSEKFIKLLQCLYDLPEEYNPNDEYSLPLGSAYTGDLKLLIETYDRSIPSSLAFADSAFGSNAQFVGFPCDSGNGVALIPGVSLGMSTGGQQKAGVWSFFKYLINEYDRLSFGFPIVSSSIDELLQKQINWTKENVKSAIVPTAHGPVEIRIHSFDANDIYTRILHLIGQIDCLAQYDASIYNIIMESCLPFFAGDKTAEQAAALIQSRVSLYLSDQYG